MLPFIFLYEKKGEWIFHIITERRVLSLMVAMLFFLSPSSCLLFYSWCYCSYNIIAENKIRQELTMKLSETKENSKVLLFGNKPLMKRVIVKTLIVSLLTGSLGAGIGKGIDFANDVFPISYSSQPLMTPMEKAEHDAAQKEKIDMMLSSNSAYATAMAKELGLGMTIIDGSDPNLKEIITELPADAVTAYERFGARFINDESTLQEFAYAKLFSGALYGSEASNALAKNFAYKVLGDQETSNHSYFDPRGSLGTAGFCVMKGTGGANALEKFQPDARVMEPYVFLHEMAHCMDIADAGAQPKAGDFFAKGGGFSRESFSDLVASTVIAQQTGNWDIVKNTIIPLRALNSHDHEHNSQLMLMKLMDEVDINQLAGMTETEVVNLAIDFQARNAPADHQQEHEDFMEASKKEGVLAGSSAKYLRQRLEISMNGASDIEINKEMKSIIQSYSEKMINYEIYNNGEKGTLLKTNLIKIGEYYVDNIATGSEKAAFSEHIKGSDLSDYEKLKSISNTA